MSESITRGVTGRPRLPAPCVTGSETTGGRREPRALSRPPVGRGLRRRRERVAHGAHAASVTVSVTVSVTASVTASRIRVGRGVPDTPGPHAVQAHQPHRPQRPRRHRPLAPIIAPHRSIAPSRQSRPHGPYRGERSASVTRRGAACASRRVSVSSQARGEVPSPRRTSESPPRAPESRQMRLVDDTHTHTRARTHTPIVSWPLRHAAFRCVETLYITE